MAAEHAFVTGVDQPGRGRPDVRRYPRGDGSMIHVSRATARPFSISTTGGRTAEPGSQRPGHPGVIVRLDVQHHVRQAGRAESEVDDHSACSDREALPPVCLAHHVAADAQRRPQVDHLAAVPNGTPAASNSASWAKVIKVIERRFSSGRGAERVHVLIDRG
jgi:hypothetical protein